MGGIKTLRKALKIIESSKANKILKLIKEAALASGLFY